MGLIRAECGLPRHFVQGESWGTAQTEFLFSQPLFLPDSPSLMQQPVRSGFTYASFVRSFIWKFRRLFLKIHLVRHVLFATSTIDCYYSYFIESSRYSLKIVLLKWMPMSGYLREAAIPRLPRIPFASSLHYARKHLQSHGSCQVLQ